MRFIVKSLRIELSTTEYCDLLDALDTAVNSAGGGSRGQAFKKLKEELENCTLAESLLDDED